MGKRITGYQHALIANRIPLDPALIRIGDWSAASGARLTRELFRRGPGPDAIFAQNDRMGIGALRSLSELGIDVPGDVAIVGFDDMDFCDASTPTLSSIRPPLEQLGRTAFQVVFDQLSGRAVSEREFRIPCAFVQRGSSGGGPAENHR